MDPTVVGGSRVEVRKAHLSLVGGTGERLVISATPRAVGRSDGCDLVIANDKQVSKVHAEFVGTEYGIRIRDLGSRNGTFVGSSRIGEVYVAENVTVRCGTTLLQVDLGTKERVNLGDEDAFGPLVGTTPRMRMLFAKLRKVAPTNLSVLILGETGTGKEVVANAIHNASKRAGRKFVVVDCTNVPAGLPESTLFGHERGAFTGATERRISPFVEAAGGTVFLDEIGELPIDLQGKLLRVLAEQRIKAVGATDYVSVDVRVLAATRRDLAREVNAGTFRSDLYFRLLQERVELPPLRERKDDLPALVRRIMKDKGAEAHFKRVSPESFRRMVRHDWPGNVRELRDAIARALAYDERGGPLEISLVEGAVQAQRGDPVLTSGTFREAVARLEAEYYPALYDEFEGNISEIARRACVDRKTVREALRRLGLDEGARRRRRS